ncbi:MFS transporter [Flavobacterium ajazii]|uniref:MFS transporter n=1 Tax=Flavobacterium ajazii TaxID=2692318 RepID=UPI0013CF8074|nr:MFS transporter [Flavobacterium ajazii]
MKFELNFDKDIYNQQMDLLFDLAWKRKIKYYKNSQYLGFLLIILGAALIYNRPNIFGIGYVFIFFGLTNLIPFVYHYFKIKSTYRKFNAAKKSEIEINKEVKDFSWEFTEEAFVINVGNQFKALPWEEFTIYLIKDDNIILITKDYQPYILGEIEVGKENFKMIISFVQNKISME